MPELPEVETIVRGIYDNLIGQTITECLTTHKKLRADSYEFLEENIIDSTFKHIYRRGKYIIAELSNNNSLLIHLGMSGKLTVQTETEILKHDHVKLWLSNKSCLTFNDPRRFGCFVMDTKENISNHSLLSVLGYEPLSDDFTSDVLFNLFKGKNTNVKSFLMNSKFIVGIGNIYASEALFMSKIHPLQTCKSITLGESQKLFIAIRDVLNAAIESGGSTLRDFVHSDGTLGYFQHNFKVYGKDTNACSTCKLPIEKIIISGRSTFFCKSCQPLET